jgi:hypothetical protein
MDIVIFIKKIGLAGLLFVLCATLAFGQRQQGETDWHKDGLQRRVKSIAIKEYTATGDSTQRGEPLESIVKQYNEQGFLTEIKEFNEDGTIAQRQVVVHLKKQREELLYGEDGKLLEKIVSKLNSAGNPTQSIVMNERGNVQEKTVYLYDEKERLVRQSGYDAKGKMSENCYYTYNNDVLNEYLGFGEYENKKIVYKYDALKNPVELLVYDSKTNVFLEKITQQFDKNKNLTEISYWDEKNVLKSSVSYRYDEKDNLLEYTVSDTDKNISDKFSFDYQYDTHNNWTLQIVYKGGGKQAESRIERSIEYYD